MRTQPIMSLRKFWLCLNEAETSRAADVCVSFSHQHLALLFPPIQGLQTHIQNHISGMDFPLITENRVCVCVLC